MDKNTVNIYTDGACSGNPGPGGWGGILTYNDKEKIISGAEEQTTNNRMELTADVEALKVLKRSCRVSLHSDSAYLINAFNNGWLKKWQANGWKNSKKEGVENQDLWQELLSLSQIHDITWIKVKGHADNEYNNRCDRLAVEAIEVKK
jgi:ribonuclease HI